MANRLLTELILKDNNFGTGIQTAKLKLDSFNGSGNGVKATLGQLGKQFGVNISSLTKLGTVAGVAGVALKGMLQIIKHNTGLLDDYDRAQKQVNAVVNSFWTTIGNGNFSNFITGLDDIIEKAGKARDALDDLQVSSFYTSNANRGLKQKYQTAIDKARDISLSKEERMHNANLAKDYAKLMALNYKIEINKGAYGSRTTLDAFMATGGYNHKLTQVLKDYFLNPQNGLQIEKDAKIGESIKEIVDKNIMRGAEVINKKLKEAGYKMDYNTWISGMTKYNRAMAWQSLRATEEGAKTILGFYDIGFAAEEGAENIASMNTTISKTIGRIQRIKAPTTNTTTSKSGSTNTNSNVVPVEIVPVFDTTKINAELRKTGADWAKTVVYTFNQTLKTNAKPRETIEETGNKALNSINSIFQSSVADEADAIDKKALNTKNAWSGIATSISLAGSAMQSLGNNGMNVAALIAQAIANVILGFAVGLPQAGKEGGVWGYIAAAVAGLATVAATVALINSLSKYANGGIIGGNSYSNDRLLARVNSGEMILNGTLLAKLWNTINHPDNQITNTVNGGKVQFEIKNLKLVGSLNNYEKKHSRL